MTFIRKNLIPILAFVLVMFLAYNPELIWVFGWWFSDLVSPMVMLPVQ